MDLITCHLNADFDCLGAMVAAKKLYPDALLAFPGAQEKGVRDFLEKQTDFPAELLRIKDVPFDRITRLILVDCRHSSRIGRFAELLDRGVEVHIYDHHPEEAADIVPTGGIISNCGSSTTLITHILMNRDLTVSQDEATVMMLGIHEDTGSLTFPTTTIDDYMAAAWLLRQGANLKTVADSLAQDLTSQQVALLNDLLNSLDTLSVNGIDVSIAQASVDYYVGDIAVLAHMIRDMENLECLFLLVGMGKRVYVIGRSRVPEVDVGAILREIGGGGHPAAASATIKDLTPIQVRSRLDQLLRSNINPRRLARDIMSSPVLTVDAGTTLRETREFLTKYNVNAMPVVDGEAMIGIISRRIVEKALYHNLGDVAVSEYMHTEYMRAAPDTPIAEVQHYIVGHNRRFVPVFDSERLVGAITRTDLLRYMYAGLRSPEETIFDVERLEMPERHRRLDNLLTMNLPKKVAALLQKLGRTGDELDLPVYAVGGFVRDLILRAENYDIDVTVEGDGILFAETFAKGRDCRVKSHEKFGTAVIIFPDGFKIDVASTRLEYYETPGALPTVERASLKMDLYRRDFTINTLAVRLNGDDYGLLIDYYGGLRDLSDKVIRVLHNLSFVEDPTRVFRAIRFEQRLNFRIAPHTENLIRNAVKMNFLEKLGGKRMLAELVHIFRESDPLRSVDRMGGLGLLQFVHPQLHLDSRMKTILGDSRKIITWFDLLYLGKPYEKWVVYFLSLTDSLDHDDFLTVCMRLAVSEHYREKLYEMRREGWQMLARMEAIQVGHTLRNSDIYFLLKDLSIEMLLYLMTKSGAEEMRRAISVFFTQLQSIRLHITGDDLKALGVPPGPQYRKLLDRVLIARLNGEAESREDELRVLCREYRGCCANATEMK